MPNAGGAGPGPQWAPFGSRGPPVGQRRLFSVSLPAPVLGPNWAANSKSVDSEPTPPPPSSALHRHSIGFRWRWRPLVWPAGAPNSGQAGVGIFSADNKASPWRAVSSSPGRLPARQPRPGALFGPNKFRPNQQNGEPGGRSIGANNNFKFEPAGSGRRVALVSFIPFRFVPPSCCCCWIEHWPAGLQPEAAPLRLRRERLLGRSIVARGRNLMRFAHLVRSSILQTRGPASSPQLATFSSPFRASLEN